LIEGQRLGWWAASTTPLTVGSLAWGWTISPVPFAFLIGVACMVAFVLHERSRIRRGRPALADLRLFGIRSFRFGPSRRSSSRW
jgi:hypothetical protein